MAKAQKTGKFLGVFALAMINVSLICSLRGLPTMAEYGLTVIFFLMVSVVFFLIPVSLVSAELATGWPKGGGIYVWVREAFGEKMGFVTIILQWVQNLVFYPTALAATAAVIAYLFVKPELANNQYYTLAVIIIVYWLSVLINLRGMKVSGRFTSIGTILGIIFPGVLLFVLGLAWIFSGQDFALTVDLEALIPDLGKVNNFVLLTGMFLFFAGMEVSGVHAMEVKNPTKDYPKAIFIAALIVTAIFLFGSLAIALIIPTSELSLTAGIMQTYLAVLNKFNLGWLVPIIALLAAPGMVVQVSSWIVGPSRGLLVTAQNGDLPPFFQKMNKNKMPVHIMIVQGILVSIIACVFMLMPSVSSSFWILTALAAILYLTVYIIMFAAAIKLKYSQPNTKRAYEVPGGKIGMWIIAGIGSLACLSAIFFGFFPPSQISTGSVGRYVGLLVIGYIVLGFIPFIVYAFRKKSWKKTIKID
ncbi:MAG: amino acid permease [Patescibacteria group bacterium]|jgi:putative glutamate/gamma-aminobutyrate antiporter